MKRWTPTSMPTCPWRSTTGSKACLPKCAALIEEHEDGKPILGCVILDDLYYKISDWKRRMGAAQKGAQK